MKKLSFPGFIIIAVLLVGAIAWPFCTKAQAESALTASQQELKTYRKQEADQKAKRELRRKGVGTVLEGCTFGVEAEGEVMPTVTDLLEAYGARPRDLREMPMITVTEHDQYLRFRYGYFDIKLRLDDTHFLPRLHNIMLSIGEWHMRELQLNNGAN